METPLEAGSPLGRTSSIRAIQACTQELQFQKEENLELLEAGVLPEMIGQLFTWGSGWDGQLGQDSARFPGKHSALPHPVPGMSRIKFVACGTGQSGCTFAIGAEGTLFSFGNNYKV